VNAIETDFVGEFSFPKEGRRFGWFLKSFGEFVELFKGVSSIRVFFGDSWQSDSAGDFRFEDFVEFSLLKLRNSIDLSTFDHCSTHSSLNLRFHLSLSCLIAS
jgi:hypothetical protein